MPSDPYTRGHASTYLTGRRCSFLPKLGCVSQLADVMAAPDSNNASFFTAKAQVEITTPSARWARWGKPIP